MIRRLSKFWQFAALTTAVLTGGAQAHSDPWGDIHPHVTVMDGSFSIVFSTQLPDQESNYTESKPVARVIYTPEGAIVAPRHPLVRQRSWRESSGEPFEHAYRVGDSSIYLGGGPAGQPGYSIVSAEGQRISVRLPWPAALKIDLDDAEVSPGGIAFSGKEDRENLKFYWFPFGSTEFPVILNLGPTVCIYHFPVASNIAWAGGKFWIAFMRYSGESTKLYLWSWKPGDKEGKEELLDSPGFGNSHLSMAAIGDRLCLAYHCAYFPDDYPGEKARIVTVFRKAE